MVCHAIWSFNFYLLQGIWGLSFFLSFYLDQLRLNFLWKGGKDCFHCHIETAPRTLVFMMKNFFVFSAGNLVFRVYSVFNALVYVILLWLWNGGKHCFHMRISRKMQDFIVIFERTPRTLIFTIKTFLFDKVRPSKSIL